MHKQLKKCQICALQNREVQIIVKCLFVKMENLKYQVIKPLKDHGQEDSFTKLVNSFFKLSPFIRQESLKCHHRRLMSVFTEKIRCTMEGLNEASDYIMMQQIKRSYELEVISSQVRQVSGQIGKGIFQPGVNKHQMFPHLIAEEDNSENIDLKIQNQEIMIGKKEQQQKITPERKNQNFQKPPLEPEKKQFPTTMNYHQNQNPPYSQYQGYYYYGNPYYYSSQYQNPGNSSSK